MQDEDWDFLLRRIENGECTPIIGPAVNEGFLPSHDELAESWSAEHIYPLPDRNNLARVSQFLAVEKYELFPNDQMAKVIAAAAEPNFSAPGQPHALLAELGLPLYITTNYDDFLGQALEKRRRPPTQAFCRWNRSLLDQHEGLDADFKPTPSTPLVYHLHGQSSTPESLVLREDDYLDFLVHITSKEYELPPQVIRAFSQTSLLFIGYNPDDWEFRVLLRGLIKTTDASRRRISVTAQFPLPAETPESTQRRAKEYLQEYFRVIDRQMHVFWGTADAFLTEIVNRRTARQTAAADTGHSAGERIDEVQLFHQMNEYFSKEDLINIAFEMGIDEDNLPEVKKSLARKLLQELKNRQQLPELVEILRRERPKVEW